MIVYGRINMKSERDMVGCYKYDNAFKDVFYVKKDIDIDKLHYEKDEVEYVKYLEKNEILDLINSNGNIRKTNIDAFLDIIEKTI